MDEQVGRVGCHLCHALCLTLAEAAAGVHVLVVAILPEAGEGCSGFAEPGLARGIPIFPEGIPIHGRDPPIDGPIQKLSWYGWAGKLIKIRNLPSV